MLQSYFIDKKKGQSKRRRNPDGNYRVTIIYGGVRACIEAYYTGSHQVLVLAAAPAPAQALSARAVESL